MEGVCRSGAGVRGGGGGRHPTVQYFTGGEGGGGGGALGWRRGGGDRREGEIEEGRLADAFLARCRCRLHLPNNVASAGWLHSDEADICA